MLLALALALAPVPLPAPTLKGLQLMPQKGCSDIAWQRYFRYLAPDNRSGSNVVLLTDYGPGRMVFVNTGNPGIQNEQFIKKSGKRFWAGCWQTRHEAKRTARLR